MMMEVVPITFHSDAEEQNLKREVDGTNCCCCYKNGDVYNMFEPCQFEDLHSKILASLVAECFQLEIKVMKNETIKEHYMMCKSCILRLKEAIAFRLQIQNAYERIQTLIERDDSLFSSYDIDMQSHYTELPNEFDALSTKSFKQSIKQEMEEQLDYSSSNSDFNVDNQLDTLENNIYDTKKKTTSFTNKIIKKHKNKDMCNKKGKRFECAVCKETFVNKVLFKRHMILHSSDVFADFQRFVCNYCGESFLTTHLLNEHISVHTRENCFQRDQYEFNMKNALKTHQNVNQDVHIKTEYHECEICQQSFDTIDQLNKHKRSHVEKKPFVCEYCGKNYVKKRTLREHYAVHAENGDFQLNMKSVNYKKRYQCTHCNKSFRKMYLLKEHMLAVNGIRNFHCDICKKSFTTKSNITKHMLNHIKKDFLCSHCGKAFARNCNLQRHLLSHVEKTVYRCEICLKAFTGKEQFETHKSNHEIDGFPCPYCDTVFQSAKDVKKHRRTHSEEKKHKCEMCDKWFMTIHHLKYHEKAHNKKKKCFICDFCGKIFERRPSLVYHLRSHVPNQTHQCEICLKKFLSDQIKKRHMKYHKSVRDFVCQHCGKGFVVRNHLELHIASHLKIKEFRCEPCNKGFHRKSHLVKHLKVCPNSLK